MTITLAQKKYATRSLIFGFTLITGHGYFLKMLLFSNVVTFFLKYVTWWNFEVPFHMNKFC